MKRSRRLKRIASAADAVCRGEERQLVEERQRLAAARAYAEKLSALGGTSNPAVTLLPEIWMAQLSRTFAEIARRDAAVALLAEKLNLSKARLDSVRDRLRAEQSHEQHVRHEKDVESFLNISLRRAPIRLR